MVYIYIWFISYFLGLTNLNSSPARDGLVRMVAFCLDSYAIYVDDLLNQRSKTQSKTHRMLIVG